MVDPFGSSNSDAPSDDAIVPHLNSNSAEQSASSESISVSGLSDITQPSSAPIVGEADATHVAQSGAREVRSTDTFKPLDLDAVADSELRVNEATKISQLPVAAPEEYFRSVPLAELASMLEGKRLDHFAVEQMIGGGGMGAVFRGHDLRLDRTVAIKVIPAAKKDPDTLRRFRQEAQAAARLDHPHIARVYYIGEAEQWNYIVFEFIDGVNIRNLVTMNGPLSIDDTVFYTRQVAEALSHAHQREVVHRDIKPSNILVTGTGVIKVVDMGLARNTAMDKSSGDATASGVTLGTFDYISPEQARNPRDADVRSDLYSLGCSMFFMLTGQPPFSEGTVLQKLLKHGSVPPPDPRGWREDVSDQVYAILMKLMAKQPAARYQNPQDLIGDLLMLAEVEDLPRSQLPATVMFAPAFTQRSLIEAHLPWMVALAFLLGSTLWLQSVQAISNGFELPVVGTKDERLSVPEAPGKDPESSEPASSGIGSEEPRGNEEGNGGQVSSMGAEEADGPYVVSEFRPAEVSESRWMPSLAAAVQQLKAIPDVEIEIRGTVTLDSIVDGSNASLKIVGSSQVPSKIVVAPSFIRELESGRGAWSVNNASLTIQNLQIEIDASRSLPGEYVGLFESNGNSDVRMRSVTITLEGTESAKAAVVMIDEFAEAEDGADSAFNALALSGFRDVDISFEDCLIRGRGVAVHAQLDLATAIPFTVSFSGSLVALSDWVLNADLPSIGVRSQVDRNLRLFCESSTFYGGLGFARLAASPVADPLFSLNRTSNSCVFENPEESSCLSIYGLDSESAMAVLNRFLFKGSDNAYDEKVGNFCKCYNRDNEEIFSSSFQGAAQDGWYLERGNERRVNWRTPRDPRLTLSEMSWEDFQLAEDRFSPGFPE